MTGNWNLIGHEWAVDMLKQHIQRDGVRHAYLFAGPPGLGRRTLALRFAQALNCPHPLADGVPCGTCRDCRQFDSMQHPDLAVVQAESEGGTLKVEQVREMRRTVVLKPYQSKYRVAVFLRFQEASEGAANALLKTLEEAPAHAILILTADTPEQLLPTITSRCEILRLRSAPLADVEFFLRSRGVDDAKARLLAHIANGRPGYALCLLEDESALEFRDEKLDDLGKLLSSTRVEKFKYAETLAKDKDALRQTLLIWGSFWRDVMLKAAHASASLSNVDRLGEIEKLSARLSLSEASQIVEHIEASFERLDKYVNARLLTEALLLDLPQM
ncbi:MAG: DNA polymerase III subunit delta' [Anaerolineales bacterium]